jgi:hypothetical protein
MMRYEIKYPTRDQCKRLVVPTDYHKAVHILTIHNVRADNYNVFACLQTPHVRGVVYLFDTLLISFLKEEVHLERCSPWVDLSVLSLAAFILLPPLGVDVLRCPPVMSQSSDEKPESDENALPVTAADSDGPFPILEEVDVSEVSVICGTFDGLPKLQWQGGPSAAALSMLNEENSSP